MDKTAHKDGTLIPSGSRELGEGNKLADVQSAAPITGLRNLSAEDRHILHLRSIDATFVAKQLWDTGEWPKFLSLSVIHDHMVSSKENDQSIIVPSVEDPKVRNLALMICSCWVLANYDEEHTVLSRMRKSLSNISVFQDRAMKNVRKDLENLDGVDVEEAMAVLAEVDVALWKLRGSVPGRSHIALETPVSWQFFALHLEKGFGDALTRQGRRKGTPIGKATYRFIAAVMPLINKQTPSLEAIGHYLGRKTRSVRPYHKTGI